MDRRIGSGVLRIVDSFAPTLCAALARCFPGLDSPPLVDVPAWHLNVSYVVRAFSREWRPIDILHFGGCTLLRLPDCGSGRGPFACCCFCRARRQRTWDSIPAGLQGSLFVDSSLYGMTLRFSKKAHTPVSSLPIVPQAHASSAISLAAVPTPCRRRATDARAAVPSGLCTFCPFSLPSVLVRGHFLYMKSARQSGGVLFMDCRSAYYTVWFASFSVCLSVSPTGPPSFAQGPQRFSAP